MAKFSPPWASVGGVTRSPTVDEHNDGFPCGDLDLELWNRLVQGIHAELAAIQDAGGITGTEGDDTTVKQAIEAMIAAATGGGDTSQFVLFSQMQANNPVYPNVTTNNGVINVTDNGDGTIRLPASATIVHRGIRPFTTAQTDFATTANKTYHLRCAISGATATYSLKDLADLAYNPTVAAETNSAFDTTYDDVLIARIVTNSSNVPTITNLTNLDRLFFRSLDEGSATFLGDMVYQFGITKTFNWARTPKTRAVNGHVGLAGTGTNGTMDGVANQITVSSMSRYSIAATVSTDWNVTRTSPSGPYGALDFNLAA